MIAGVAEAMSGSVAFWGRRYRALTAEQRAEYGPFAARRWPTAYARRAEPGWDGIWQTLLAWLVTDPQTFGRVSRELANAEAAEQRQKVLANAGAKEGRQ